MKKLKRAESYRSRAEGLELHILEMIKELEDDIARCVKCGSCRSVCPVFGESNEEPSVARGKMALVEALSKGRLRLTRTFAEMICCCLLCGACTENCPSGVKVDYIVIKARVIAAKINRLSFIKWVILKIFLKNRWLFNLSLKLGSFVQGILLKSKGIHHTYTSRLRIGLNSKRMVLPLERITLRNRWPEIVSPKNPRGRVALFTGCVMNHILVGVGDAVIKVLLKHDIEVVIPKKQSCCGIVAMASGDETTFRTLSENNLKLLSELDVDAIIVACATCGYTLKCQYLTLLYNNEAGDLHDMAKRVADKTADICEYLINVIGVTKISHKDIRDPVDETLVTCHDPCHLRRGLGIYKEPRDLVHLINGVRLQEMSMPDRCCGGGGNFNLSYYEISLKILKKKIDDIEKTGATVVLTSCAGCHLQLVDGLAQRSSPIRVRHPVELYCEALERV